MRTIVKSGRYDKSEVKPTWVKCPKCLGDMLPLVAHTSRVGVRMHFKVPLRYCNICKIAKALAPMEFVK